MNPDGCEVLLVRFKSLIILTRGKGSARPSPNFFKCVSGYKYSDFLTFSQFSLYFY